MKSSLFVMMALLLATPALGAVVITCTDEGGTTPKVVRIDYDATGESSKVRAFALHVSVDANCAKISNVTDYSGGTGDKYGIFPGTIDLNDIENPVWGTPVAPSDDPGAQGTGLGTSRVILEMGSLYDPNHSGPPNTGTLCNLQLTDPCEACCHVSITVENIRGGVVLENGATAGITSTGCDVCWVQCICCGDVDRNGLVQWDDRVALTGLLNTYGHPVPPPRGPISIEPADAEWDPCGDVDGNGLIQWDDRVTITGWLNTYGVPTPPPRGPISVDCDFSNTNGSCP